MFIYAASFYFIVLESLLNTTFNSFMFKYKMTLFFGQSDEYKIEKLKGAKFSWQVDPRFQDSSSDEEGVDEVEEDQSASSKITE